MTWEKPRPSILQRPLKPFSYNNRENLDSEWEKEQQKTQARRDRYAMIDERLRVANGGATVEDKKRLASEDREFSKSVIETRSLKEKIEKEHEKEAMVHASRRDVALAMSEEEVKMRKREEQRRVMEENMALAEERKRAAQDAKRREQEMERRNNAILAQQSRSFR
eukprot:TRINITY_DN26461_c0_g1_i1.p1 TRINITY_DN26461_c0_g1~~TRINITY_DN26461_c0_g1_i1.p1  ORF type:complete len:166 (+),score=45.34 TRINITY_DN26461_c0_g1_i1:40-537(+)